MEARQARDIALGYIREPYEAATVMRSVEVARGMMASAASKPGAVPAGLELFSPVSG